VFYLKGFQMKKPLMAALLGAALCSPWPALADSAYLKLGLGQSRYSAATDTETGRALSLAYGAALDSTWGYEVGYIHFGKLSEGAYGLSQSIRSQALYGAAVANLPLNTATRVYSKVGLAAVNTKLSVSAGELGSGAESGTNTNLMAGLGLDYKFSPQIAANIEYQYFGNAYKLPINLSAWTVGLKYGF
jgi:opacity protein-like surface antigen